jgi:hypothetical protein
MPVANQKNIENNPMQSRLAVARRRDPAGKGGWATMQILLKIQFPAHIMAIFIYIKRHFGYKNSH